MSASAREIDTMKRWHCLPPHSREPLIVSTADRLLSPSLQVSQSSTGQLLGLQPLAYSQRTVLSEMTLSGSILPSTFVVSNNINSPFLSRDNDNDGAYQSSISNAVEVTQTLTPLVPTNVMTSASFSIAKVTAEYLSRCAAAKLPPFPPPLDNLL